MRLARQPGTKLRWALLVLLVALNFVAVQTAAAIEVHPHHHGGPNDHCCAGCHGGHFPVLQTVSTVQPAAMPFAAWHSIVEVTPHHSDDGRAFDSSRAPPA